MVALIPVLIVIAVALIAGIILLAKLAKNVFKWVLIVGVVMLIVSIIFGVNVFNDFKSLQENFPTAQKVFLLNDLGTIRAGFIQGSGEPDFTSIDSASLADYRAKYKTESWDETPAGTFIILVDSAALSAAADISFADAGISAAQAMNIIKAQSSIDAALPILITAQGVRDTPDTRALMKRQLTSNIGISSDQTMRNVLFAQLFGSSVQDSASLITLYQSGSIKIYPDSSIFKLLRIIPSGILKSVAGAG